jgi:hypothetical protein
MPTQNVTVPVVEPTTDYRAAIEKHRAYVWQTVDRMLPRAPDHAKQMATLAREAPAVAIELARLDLALTLAVDLLAGVSAKNYELQRRGDALLDYRDPPTTPRADRFVELEATVARQAAELAEGKGEASRMKYVNADSPVDALHLVCHDASADMVATARSLARESQDVYAITLTARRVDGKKEGAK